MLIVSATQRHNATRAVILETYEAAQRACLLADCDCMPCYTWSHLAKTQMSSTADIRHLEATILGLYMMCRLRAPTLHQCK
jgi:hypothetical protein